MDRLALSLNQHAADLVVALNALPLSSDLPNYMLLAPAGRFVGRDGREYLNDNPAGVLAHFQAMKLPVVVDYEHGSELLAPGGHQAPAAGWIEELVERDGAILGRVDWTERAQAMLQAREYRYFSPALLIDRDAEPPRVRGIKSVGLTNQPNLDVPALNTPQPPKERTMDKAIRQALGLNDEATADDAVAAINTLKGERDTALNRSATPSLDLFVPRADYDTALNRAATAEQQLADQRQAQHDAAIETVIQGALDAKKITPATVEYHRAQCATDGGLERFKAYIDQAPTVAADSGIGKGKPPASAPQLNAEQAHVAKILGKPVAIFTDESAS